jgi:hypothetical protein
LVPGTEKKDIIRISKQFNAYVILGDILGGKSMISYNLTVNENVLQKDMYYKEQLVLNYTIKYPQFVSDKFNAFIRKLNNYYKTKAIMYQEHIETKLYKMAIQDYENAVDRGFPIRQYEIVSDYKVTYNQSCGLSLYFDHYEYTGGAHGITNRISDTWDIKSGKRIDLHELFTHVNDYQENIIKEINEQIEDQIEESNMMYFDDYEQLVADNFDTEDFYLVPEGVIIYFQLYEIAPYVAGIPTFLIPFTTSAVKN